MSTAIFLLGEQLDDSYDLLCRAMADVDDEMLHWEPVSNCWGLRLRNGQWVCDWDKAKAAPKTIGWLASHIAACKEMYFEYAFGPAKKTWEQLGVPHDAAGLREYLNRAQKQLRGQLAKFNDNDLDRLVLANWGEQKPVWWIYWIMIYHDVEHGGQIMQVKNEYLNRVQV
jgi:hypothetical protein